MAELGSKNSRNIKGYMKKNKPKTYHYDETKILKEDKFKIFGEEIFIRKIEVQDTEGKKQIITTTGGWGNFPF